MAHGEPILYSLYIYAPIKGIPTCFAILYGISAVLYIWQCRRYSAFKLIGLHLICAVLFTLGYALREYGAYNYLYKEEDSTPLIVFVLSQVFIYVCPPLLELANYHTLGRIFHYVPFMAPIPAGRVMGIFGGIMALVELLNALGVALASNPTSEPSQQALGGRLTIAALSIQLAIIATFVGIAGTFHLRCVRARPPVHNANALLLTLYASMALILGRCVYRLVEHLGPTQKDLGNLETLRALSPLFRYEAFFYVFEASLMLVNSLLWNVWSPGRYLPRERNVYLAADGRETVGDKDVDGRGAWAKVANVATFGLAFGMKRTDYAAHEMRQRRGSREGSAGGLVGSPQAL